MDLKYVRSELQKLSEIIDNWDTPQETAALERDLVLEKLRKLYDAVRFGADADFAAVREDPIVYDFRELLQFAPHVFQIHDPYTFCPQR